MREITSCCNEKIKNAIKLGQKKFREETGLVLIEGYKIFLEAVKTKQSIVEIFVTKKEFEKVDLKGFEQFVTIVGENVSEKLSFNKTSQNFFAVVKKPKVETCGGNFLILDNIQDPQNLGAIIRTSVACDIKKIYLLDCVDEFNDKVVRASMGNVFKVSCESVNLADLTKICGDYEIFCADMNGQNLFELKEKPKKFGLILGNEGNGVSLEVKKFSTKIVSIPMKNQVESLNVAVSMAIVAYNLLN